MKITKKNLEKIIKEEVEEVVRTVSADYLDLESTLNEFFTSSFADDFDSESFKQLQKDIKAGKKDNELDALASEYGCDYFQAHGFEGAICPVIHQRQGIRDKLPAIVMDIAHRRGYEGHHRRDFLAAMRQLEKNYPGFLGQLDRSYVKAKKNGDAMLISKLKKLLMREANLLGYGPKIEKTAAERGYGRPAKNKRKKVED